MRVSHTFQILATHAAQQQAHLRMEVVQLLFQLRSVPDASGLLRMSAADMPCLAVACSPEAAQQGLSSTGANRRSRQQQRRTPTRLSRAVSESSLLSSGSSSSASGAISRGPSPDVSSAGAKTTTAEVAEVELPETGMLPLQVLLDVVFDEVLPSETNVDVFQECMRGVTAWVSDGHIAAALDLTKVVLRLCDSLQNGTFGQKLPSASFRGEARRLGYVALTAALGFLPLRVAPAHHGRVLGAYAGGLGDPSASVGERIACTVGLALAANVLPDATVEVLANGAFTARLLEACGDGMGALRGPLVYMLDSVTRAITRRCTKSEALCDASFTRPLARVLMALADRRHAPESWLVAIAHQVLFALHATTRPQGRSALRKLVAPWLDEQVAKHACAVAKGSRDLLYSFIDARIEPIETQSSRPQTAVDAYFGGSEALAASPPVLAFGNNGSVVSVRSGVQGWIEVTVQRAAGGTRWMLQLQGASAMGELSGDNDEVLERAMMQLPGFGGAGVRRLCAPFALDEAEEAQALLSDSAGDSAATSGASTPNSVATPTGPSPHLQARAALHRAIKVLEVTPAVEIGAVGVLFVRGGAGLRTEAEVLAETGGSPAYEAMLRGLGTRVRLAGHLGYAGGMDTSGSNADGAWMLVHRTVATSLVFHVATLMPNASGDDASLNKKRHIGNDYVSIVWLDGVADADTTFSLDDISSQFAQVFITVRRVHGRDLYAVQLECRPPLEPVLPLPLRHRVICPGDALAGMLRALASQAHAGAVRNTRPSMWESRVLQIETILRKFS